MREMAALDDLSTEALLALKKTINALLLRRKRALETERLLLQHEREIVECIAAIGLLTPDAQALLGTMMTMPAPGIALDDPRLQGAPEAFVSQCVREGLLRYVTVHLEEVLQGAGFTRTHGLIKHLLAPTQRGMVAWQRWRPVQEAVQPPSPTT